MSEENTVIDLLYYSDYLPKLNRNEIMRDTILDALETAVQVNDIVLINGNSGNGKSIVLRQFCEKNSKNTISLFIRESKPASYDEKYLLVNLVEQLFFFLKGTSLDTLLRPEEQLLTQLQRLIVETSRTCKAKNKTLFFVIDGIYHIPKEKIFIINNVINQYLPLSMSSKIKFIFSLSANEQSDFAKNEISRTESNIGDVSVVGLSNQEIQVLFPEVSSEYVEQIRSHFLGNTREIFNFQRQYDSGFKDLDQLPSDLFSLSWEKSELTEDDKRVLAITVFSSQNLSVNDLAEIENTSVDEIRMILSRNIFIESTDEYFELINDNYYSKLRSKLSYFEKEVYEKISSWIIQQDKIDSFVLIPEYLEGAQKFTELFTFLDEPKHINSIIASQSMGSVRQIVERGFSLSEELGSVKNSLKFAIESSMFDNQDISQKKQLIEALFTLSEYSEARDIANTEIVPENKVILLCIIARLQKEKNGTIDIELVNQIKKLYMRLNLRYLGSKRIEIASELIFADPETALSLFEKSFDLENDENSFDRAMVDMSLAAIDSGKVRSESSDVLGVLQKKAKNQKIQDIFSDFSTFLKDISSEGIIDEIENIKQVNAKINFLAMWCGHNQPSEQSFEICKYAFQLINSSDEYRSNAGVYRQLSNQMKFQDLETTRKMTGLFEGHLETLKKSGPIIEFVQLCLNIIEANELSNVESNINRIGDLYSYISLEKDLSIQMECYAYLLKYLHSSDYQKSYDDDLNISELVTISIDEIIDIVLSDIAHQYDALKGTLCLMVTIDAVKCIETIKKVNNQPYREYLYHDIITSLCISAETHTGEAQQFITDAISTLYLISENDVIFDDSAATIISCFYEFSDEGLAVPGSLVYKLLDIVKSCTSIVTKIKCLNLLSLALSKISDTKFTKQSQELSNEALDLVNSIDLMHLKISLSLQTIKLIGDKNLSLALKYYSNVSSIIEDFGFIEPMEFWNSIKCIRLLIRSYKGIAKSQKNSEKDDVYLPKLLEIITHLESPGEEAILLSETAIVLFKNNQVREGKEVCKRMITLINSISSHDKHYKCRVIRMCAPALFVNHKGTFERLLCEMSNFERDQTYYEVVYFLFNGYSYSEPIHAVDSKFYSCQYEELIDICEIIDKLSNDSAQYELIKEVIKATKSNYVNLKQEAKDEIFRILKEYSKKLFPSKLNIQHEGYKIVSESSVMNATGFNLNVYESLTARADALPNKTDRIFVKTMLYNDIEKQRNYQKLTEEVYTESKLKIEEIPLIREKIYQLELLAEAFKTKKSVYSKELIEDGINLLQKDSDSSSIERGRGLIDMAYQIDPDFGKSLVSTIQSSSISTEKKMDTSKEHDMHNTKYMLKDKKNKPDIESLNNRQKENIPNICWEWLGLLQGKKNAPQKVSELYKQYLPFASSLPMESGYKIYSWLIENNNNKPSTKNMPFEIFEGVYSSCKIIFWKKTNLNFKNSDNQSREGVVVTNSEGREGLDFILKWIEENASKKITICDPYFSAKELDIVQEMSFIKSDFEFEILTSKEHVDKELGLNSIEGFRNHWKDNISEETPPEVLIVIAGQKKSKKLPIHDRYILTETHGLYIGGSLNGLNSGREFSISVLSEGLFDEWRIKIDQYINNNQTYFKNHDQKVDIQSFWL